MMVMKECCRGEKPSGVTSSSRHSSPIPTHLTLWCPRPQDMPYGSYKEAGDAFFDFLFMVRDKSPKAPIPARASSSLPTL